MVCNVLETGWMTECWGVQDGSSRRISLWSLHLWNHYVSTHHRVAYILHLIAWDWFASAYCTVIQMRVHSIKKQEKFSNIAGGGERGEWRKATSFPPLLWLGAKTETSTSWIIFLAYPLGTRKREPLSADVMASCLGCLSLVVKTCDQCKRVLRDKVIGISRNANYNNQMMSTRRVKWSNVMMLRWLSLWHIFMSHGQLQKTHGS